jgi:hypothetical protein
MGRLTELFKLTSLKRRDFPAFFRIAVLLPANLTGISVSERFHSKTINIGTSLYDPTAIVEEFITSVSELELRVEVFRKNGPEV